MAFVTHGKPGNNSRPRELLERRTKERLWLNAEYLGHSGVTARTTKSQLIEMITTDDALPSEDTAESTE